MADSFSQTIFQYLPKLRNPTAGLTEAQCDANGALKVSVVAQTTAVATTWIDPAPGTPLTYQRVVASVAKSLWGVYGANEGASDRWIMIFDRATLATNGAEPTYSFRATAGQPFSFTLDRARLFTAGIAWAVSSTAGTLTVDTAATFRINVEVS